MSIEVWLYIAQWALGVMTCVTACGIFDAASESVTRSRRLGVVRVGLGGGFYLEGGRDK